MVFKVVVLIMTTTQNGSSNCLEAHDGEEAVTNASEFRMKVFMPRNSVLTDLFEDKYIRSVYNLAMALCVGTIFYSILSDYYSKGWVYLGVPFLASAFARFDVVVLIWLCMFGSVLFVYYCFTWWAGGRSELQLIEGNTALWDVPWMLALLTYFGGLLYFPPYMVLKHNLGVMSTMLILIEQVRVAMKIYAFVRSNCPKYLKAGIKEKLRIAHPTYLHFLYFWFAPTLVYQDNYPRANRNINWSFVINCLIQQAVGWFASAIVWQSTYQTELIDYGLKSFTAMDVTLVGIRNAPVGLMLMLMAFYYSYHALFNMIAEILLFEDRLFYQDWWISSSLERFLRTWSVIIHDWLYLYMYKDLYQFVFPKSKALSKIIIYIALAVGHDYILGFACRVYLPLNCVLYSVTVALLNIGNIRHGKLGNILLWLSYTALLTVTFTVYTAEYYAYKNCPVKKATIFSYVIPRFVTCLVK